MRCSSGQPAQRRHSLLAHQCQLGSGQCLGHISGPLRQPRHVKRDEQDRQNQRCPDRAEECNGEDNGDVRPRQRQGIERQQGHNRDGEEGQDRCRRSLQDGRGNGDGSEDDDGKGVRDPAGQP